MSRMVVLFSLVLEVVGRLLAGCSLHWCDELSARIKPTYLLLPLFWSLVDVEVASVRLLVRRLSLGVAVLVDCSTDLDVHASVGLSSVAFSGPWSACGPARCWSPFTYLHLRCHWHTACLDACFGWRGVVWPRPGLVALACCWDGPGLVRLLLCLCTSIHDSYGFCGSATCYGLPWSLWTDGAPGFRVLSSLWQKDVGPSNMQVVHAERPVMLFHIYMQGPT